MLRSSPAESRATKTQRHLTQLSLNEFSMSKHTPTQISTLSLLEGEWEKKRGGGLGALISVVSTETAVEGIIEVLHTYAHIYIYVCAYIYIHINR